MNSIMSSFHACSPEAFAFACPLKVIHQNHRYLGDIWNQAPAVLVLIPEFSPAEIAANLYQYPELPSVITEGIDRGTEVWRSSSWDDRIFSFFSDDDGVARMNVFEECVFSSILVEVDPFPQVVLIGKEG